MEQIGRKEETTSATSTVLLRLFLSFLFLFFLTTSHSLCSQFALFHLPLFPLNGPIQGKLPYVIPFGFDYGWLLSSHGVVQRMLRVSICFYDR